MSTDDINAIVTTTRRLSMVAPDPAWADQLRARCRTKITQRAKPPSQPARSRIPVDSIIATAVLGSFSALYLLSVVYDVIRLYREP